MAAFNFAYVLGQDYLKDILLKGLGITTRIQLKTDNRIEELNDVIEIIDTHSSSTKAKKEKGKKVIREEIIPQLKKLQQKYKLDVSTSIPFGFPQLCLIGGILCIYSILVDGCNGAEIFWSDSKYSVVCHFYFSLFCIILYLLFLLVTLNKRVNNWAVNKPIFITVNSTICYLSIAALTIIYLTVCNLPWFSNFFDSESQQIISYASPNSLPYIFSNTPLIDYTVYDTSINFHILSYSSILMLTTGHFLLFLILASYSGRNFYSSFEKDFVDIEESYNVFKGKHDAIHAADSRHKDQKSSSPANYSIGKKKP